MDTNKHKFFMLQLLKDIFNDALLSSVLAFKGGTATMFFHNLPRFSTDLDFNLLDSQKEEVSVLWTNKVMNGLTDFPIIKI